MPAVLSETGKVWMDRNLGASQVATAIDDSAAYGDLYQWGRGPDGHQSRSSDTVNTQSSGDDPGHSKFIIGNTEWQNPQNDTLWEGVSGINIPCPAGFRLPTEVEWQNEITRYNAATDWTALFNSPLRLVAAGYRLDDGSFDLIGSNGRYWSSTTDSPFTRNLGFISGNTGIGSNTRADGFSVRCIKD